jgi:hypothetical protein
VDGLVLRDFTPSTLVDAMQRLATEPALRQRFAASAVADRDRFSREHFITAQKAIYETFTPAQHSGAVTHA